MEKRRLTDEAELRRIYEASPLALVFFKVKGKEKYPWLISQGFCDLLGHDRESIANELASGQNEVPCENGKPRSVHVTIKGKKRKFLAQSQVLEFNGQDYLIVDYVEGETNEANRQTEALVDRLETIPGQIYKGNLWDAVFRSKDIGVFWKDTKRRFLGVNQRFLDYYGLQLDDVLGKTDDDMAWNEQNEAFRKAEEEVLHGQPARSWGTTIAKGRSQTIVAYKAPLYSEEQIVGLAGFFIDVSEQQDKIDELEKEALQDSLTSLRNRWALDHDFIDRFAGKKIVAMIIDIDLFKLINDNYGHRFGDETLKTVSQAIRDVYGDEHCYRYGGDEFLVICDYVPESELRRRDQVIRQDLLQSNILGTIVDIHISGGYTWGRPENLQAFWSLVNTADKFLYRSKENGRNQITGGPFFDKK